MAKLTLKNVSKQYPTGKKALVDFSLEVPEKEFIVIVGPSGCGKTTLLRLIAGLESVSKGEIYMDDVLVNKVKPKDRSVTLVFQNYALFPYMTAYENIAFGLKISGMSKEETDAKVMEAANILGIRNELQFRPRSLSGGQRQRVALGRAMVRSPKFFLLDEPLSNLDAKLRAEMRTQIAELYDRLDATFIYVTHDQVEAMTMGNRIVVINDGVMQQIGTPTEIYDRPANKFVAGFIGYPEINFLYGVLLDEGENVRLTMCGEKIYLPHDMFERADKSLLDGKRGVIVGIRPEDVLISSEPNENFHVVNAVVRSVDVLGHDYIVYTKVGGANVTLKTAEPVKRGSKIMISIDKRRMCFFSAVTGKNIIDYGT